MTNDTMLGTVYILMAIMLVIAAMLSRRGPIAQMVTTGVALAGIFTAGFIIFTFRDDLGYLGQRLKAEATGEPVMVGETLRIPMAMDGHFWVEARVNGVPVKFLVDTGATMTTIDRTTARRTNVEIDQRREQIVRTGNGLIKVAIGRADQLVIDTIDRSYVGVHISDQEDINVLGMNFLSTLDRWGVEGRWLVLEG
jgi:aspartyl protease family protein